MKPIRDIYPEADKWGMFSVSYYQPLLESFEYPIVLQIDDDDWQGDSRLLLRDSKRWGFLIFGWGSCSGCDTLQACQSYEEVEELRQGLLHDIHWEDDAQKLLSYMENKDWEGEWYWLSDNSKKFIVEAIALLKKEEK